VLAPAALVVAPATSLAVVLEGTADVVGRAEGIRRRCGTEGSAAGGGVAAYPCPGIPCGGAGAVDSVA
jgi:hypothetical protein